MFHLSTGTKPFVQLQILIADYILHKIPLSFNLVLLLFIF